MLAYLQNHASEYLIEKSQILDKSDTGEADIRNVEITRRDEDIRVLDLSRNKLTSLEGGSIAKCENLQFVDISQNELKNLDGIDDIPKLVFIDFSGNQIANMRGIERCGSLKCVFAANNQIRKVRLSNATDTEVLVLRENPLGSLDFGHLFPSLAELDVCDCALSSLSGISAFGELKQLNASRNALDGKQEVASESLLTIDVSHNRFASLSPF